MIEDTRQPDYGDTFTGIYIKDIIDHLEDLGFTVEDLADRIGYNPERLEAVLVGTKLMDAQTAIDIERELDLVLLDRPKTADEMYALLRQEHDYYKKIVEDVSKCVGDVYERSKDTPGGIDKQKTFVKPPPASLIYHLEDGPFTVLPQEL